MAGTRPVRAAPTATIALLVSLTGATAWAAPCPIQPPADFERQGYSVRKAHVAGFWLLARALDSMSGPLADLAGTPFSEAAVLHFRNVLREAIKQLPTPFESPISVTVVASPRLVNCQSTTSGNQLDIEYPVFTTKVPTTTVRTRESAELERSDPRRALALGPANPQLSVTPAVGYDASRRLWSGGRLRGRWPGADLEADGLGSTKSRNANVAMSGTREVDNGWLRQLTWRGGVVYAVQPADRISLKSRTVLGQVSFMTAPVGPAGVLFRFGTLIEGGSGETALSDIPLERNLVAASRFANWRTYGGLSLRHGRQAFAASYGLLLGRTGTERTVDYRKHIIDVAHDSQVGSKTRRRLDISSRFTAGVLTRPGPTPLHERFFGGNAETPFVPGSAWMIRSNPVVRGIPAYKLTRPSVDASGTGADRFAVVNLTVGIPVFAVPLLPGEASQDQALRTEVNNLLASGVDVLQVLYEVDDPAQRELFDTRRSPLEKTTGAMEARVAAVESSVPEALEPAYEACAEKIGDLAASAADIRTSTPWRMFIDDNPDERGIPVVIQLCLVDLNGSLHDEALSRLGNELREHERVIAAQLAKIDSARARRLAEATMAFPRTVIQKAFDEMNLVSLSPVLLFDAGRIGDSNGRSSSRYALGGGVRLTVASSVSFEVDYARNLKPQPGEGPGALLVAARFIDLLAK